MCGMARNASHAVRPNGIEHRRDPSSRGCDALRRRLTACRAERQDRNGRRRTRSKGRGAASFVPGVTKSGHVEAEDDGRDGLYAVDEFTPDPRPDTRVPKSARAVSSAATSRRTSASASRSTRIAVASTAACTASRGPRTPTSTCRPPDFETRLFAKTNAAELLRKELAKPGYCAASDRAGHQHRCLTSHGTPLHRITRQCLEVLAEARAPGQPDHQVAQIARDIWTCSRRWPSKGLVSAMIGDHARQQTLVETGTARRRAAHAHPHDRRRVHGAGVPVGGDGRAGHPDGDRQAHGAHPRSRARRGCRAAITVLLRLPHE